MRSGMRYQIYTLNVAKKKDWITPEIWNQINIKRQTKKKVINTKSPRLKNKYQQDYSGKHRNVKTLVRADKRRYKDNYANQAEEAANRREQGNLYKITKIICRKFKSSPNIPVKDKQRNLLTSEIEQEKRWAEHFGEILNRSSSKELPSIPEPSIELEISIEPPTISEIVAAIKTLKNGKAPGSDNLNVELFKTDPILAANTLQPIFHKIWKEDKVPTE
ncbi:uncharacterized protein [Mytilus edulis]|uniref:uncharacterized protein n=1 Tax=Mytilus edulis TaxID=6550 RepID=UPI0039EF025E